jgi:hypothetical protein
VTRYHHPSLDDVIIIPLVFVALSANKILRFILSILMRLLDYAFPLAMQLVWLPLFAAKVLGDGIVAIINGALRFLPFSETKLRQWSETIRWSWSWLRWKISYRVFEHAVHIAFESGMAWVFRKCRHLTPNTALLVIRRVQSVVAACGIAFRWRHRKRQARWFAGHGPLPNLRRPKWSHVPLHRDASSRRRAPIGFGRREGVGVLLRGRPQLHRKRVGWLPEAVLRFRYCEGRVHRK